MRTRKGSLIYSYYFLILLAFGDGGYLQLLERLLVVGAGGVRWIKNSQPGEQSTVMGAGVDLKYNNKRGDCKNIPINPDR